MRLVLVPLYLLLMALDVVTRGPRPRRPRLPMSAPTLPALLTVSEVAAALRVSEASAYRYLAAGVLPAVRVGGLLRVRADAVQQLVEDGSADARPSAAPTATASRTGTARGRRHPRGTS